MAEHKEVTIYTDGSCVGNPGPGGYAALLLFGEHRKELSGGYRRTTNNRMELLAVIAGLQALKCPCRVTVCSDARYVVDGVMTGMARRWRARGWRLGASGPARNADLWARLLELCDRHEVTLTWVQGHAGNLENEHCNLAAQLAAIGPELGIDEGYENPEAVLAAVGPPSLFDGLEG